MVVTSPRSSGTRGSQPSSERAREMSGQRRAVARPVRVDARVDAFVPASYIGGEALKIDLHRRLALVEHEDELRELRAATEE